MSRALKLLALALGAVVFLGILAAAGLASLVLTTPHPRVAAPSVPAAPAPPMAPAPKTQSVHLVTFRDNKLDECDDFTLTAPADVDAATLGAAMPKPKSIKGVETTVLQRPCAEQLSGKPPIATCSIDQPSASHPGWRDVVEARYYNVATAVDSDVFMKECLQMGGSWTVSDDADTETLRQRSQQSRKLLEKLTPP